MTWCRSDGESLKRWTGPATFGGRVRRSSNGIRGFLPCRIARRFVRRARPSRPKTRSTPDQELRRRLRSCQYGPLRRSLVSTIHPWQLVFVALAGWRSIAVSNASPTTTLPARTAGCFPTELRFLRRRNPLEHRPAIGTPAPEFAASIARDSGRVSKPVEFDTHESSRCHVPRIGEARNSSRAPRKRDANRAVSTRRTAPDVPSLVPR